MEKNNLEKLFQEKLKDFHETPDEHVWESISSSLDTKKKKKVIPIWWKLGGIAAVLAFLFYVVNPFKSAIPVSQTADTVETTNKKSNNVVNTQKLSNDTIEKPRSIDSVELADTEADKPYQDKENTKKEDLVKTNKDSQNRAAAVASGTKGSNISSSKKDSKKNITEYKERVTVAAKESKEEKFDNNKSGSDVHKAIQKSKTSGIASSETNEEKQKSSTTQKQNLEKELSNKTEAIAFKDTEKKDEKKSIFDAIEEQQDDADKTEIAETNKNKWSVGPSVAPVYFDAVGQGSPIHSSFVENSKSGNINLSYGLTVAYDLGKRLKVRSGIHKVDYGYDTNEVVFSSSIATNSIETIENIDFSQTSRTIVVESKRNNTSELARSDASDFSAQSPQRDGLMSQQLGYLEVPLELNYALVDKKLGVNVIGGFSSLFLVDNSITLASEGLVTQVGEANNINAVNFSGNFGFGFSYQFSPKVHVNLEPVFKYQLNTFSQTAGTFNPYSVGVYSGVRFNF
jgi:hypothetical protein